MIDAATEQGLTSAGGGSAPAQAGPPPETSSRSTSSIVAGNVFTLFNAIIGVFFVLDPLAGPVRRRRLRPDRDRQLLHRHPPGAEGEADARRAGGAGRADGEGACATARWSSLLAEEVVPGDVIAVEPGDQLVADGEVIASRGHDPRRVDADRRGRRDPQGAPASGCSRAPSASPARAATWSTRSARRATRASSPARRSAFRHPPSPLQDEVNQVIVACTWAMLPLAALLLITFQLRARRPGRGGADGDRRPGHADPRGPGAADERHLRRRRGAAGPRRHAGPADERDREPRRGRHDLRRQDRHADRRRAAPARGRGRRRASSRGRGARGAGGASRPAPATATARWRRSPSASPARPGGSAAKCRSPRSGSGAACGSAARSYVMGAPDVLERSGALALPPGLAAQAGARRRRPAAASSPSARSAEALPGDRRRAAAPPRLAPLALVVLEETLRPDAAETIAFMRERGSRPEADLRRRPRDGHRGRLRASACPRDAGVDRGPRPARRTRRSWPRRRSENTIFCRIAPEQKKALVGGAARRRAATRR